MIIVGACFIGRKYCANTFLKCIENLDYSKEQLYFFWVDNSNDFQFNRFLQARLEKMLEKYSYAGGRVVKLTHQCFGHKNLGSEEQKREKLEAVVKSMQPIFEEAKKMKADLFLVEDDTLFPKNALKKFWENIVLVDGAVACAGISFFSSEKGALGSWKGMPSAWKLEDWPRAPGWIARPIFYVNSGVRDYGACGTGCILIKHEALKNYVISTIESPLGLMGQDINLGHYINKVLGKKLLVDWSVICPHVFMRFDGKVEIIGMPIFIEEEKIITKLDVNE